jgi:hypothetical protein
MLKQGLLKRGGHSPNQGGLATRKVCQNDELAARLAAVDKALTGPYLCPVATMAMAFILLRFWLLNQGLSNSHPYGG